MRSIVILFTILSYWSSAQDYSSIDFFEDNAIIYNPATTGINNGYQVNTLYKSRINKIDGTPTFYSLNGSYKLTADSSKINHGIGLIFNRETAGANRNMLFTTSYSIGLNLKKSWRVNLGAAIGIQEFGINQDILNPIVPDPTISEGWKKDIRPDLAIGAYFSSNNLYFGIGIQKLTSPKADFENLGYTDFPSQQYFTIGSNINISKTICLKPAIIANLSKQDPINFKGGVTTHFKELVSLGILYSDLDAVTILASGKIKKTYTLGYSFTKHIGLIPWYVPNHEIVFSTNINP